MQECPGHDLRFFWHGTESVSKKARSVFRYDPDNMSVLKVSIIVCWFALVWYVCSTVYLHSLSRPSLHHHALLPLTHTDFSYYLRQAGFWVSSLPPDVPELDYPLQYEYQNRCLHLVFHTILKCLINCCAPSHLQRSQQHLRQNGHDGQESVCHPDWSPGYVCPASVKRFCGTSS